jgi:hypothetical protein
MGASQAAGAARASWTRRSLRALGIAAAALVLLALVLYATRSALLLPWLGARVAAALERRNGMELSFGEVSGDLFTDLELRDVRLEDSRPEAPVPRAEIGWARVSYDAWGLLRGDLTAIEELEASRVRVELRVPGPTPGAAREPRAWSPPEHLPRLRLRDVALRFDDARGTLRLGGADVDLAPRADGAHALALAAGGAAWTLADGRSGRFALRAELALAGSRLELGRLELDGVELARASWIELGRAAFGELAWAGTLLPGEGVIVHSGALNAGRLALDLAPHGVRLQPLLEIAWPRLDLPDARLDGRLGLELDTARPAEVRVSWTGRMEELRWAGRELERLDGEAVYEDGVLAVATLEAGTGNDSLQASAVRVPLGLGALDTLRAARGALRLETSDLTALLRGMPEAGELEGLAPFESWAPAHRLELALQFDEGLLQLERGSLVLPDGSLQLSPGSLRLGATGLRDAVLDIGLEFDFRDLSGLARLVQAPREWSGALAGRLDVRGSVDAPLGELALAGREVVAAGVALGEVEARAAAERGSLRVETFESRGSAGSLSAHGGYDFEAARLIDVELELDVPDLAPLSAGRLDGGALTLRARLSGAPTDPGGALELEARDVSGDLLAGRRVPSLSAAARLEPGRLTVERCALEYEGVTLDAAGALAHTSFRPPLALELERFSARRGALDLALAAPARIELDRGWVSLPELRATGSAGDLSLSLALDGDALDLELSGARLDPGPLLAPFVAPGFELDGVTCELRIERRGGELTCAGELDVARLRPGADLPEFALSARGRLADGRVTLEHLRVGDGQNRRLELAGEAPLLWNEADPLGPGPLRLQGSLDLQALDLLPWERFGLELPLTGDLGLDLDVGGDWDALVGSLALRGERLAVVSPRARTELFGPARLVGWLEFDAAGVRLSSLEFRAPDQAAILAEGSLGSALRPRAWWTRDDGGLADGALAGRVRLEAAELALAARLSAGVRRLGGSVTGEVALSGTPRAPQLQGTLEVADGELRLERDAPGLMDLGARLEFTHERLTIVALHGEIGGGPLDASGSVDWSSGEPVFDLRLEGREVLLVQTPDLRLRSDVELAVRGPLAALAIAGRLDLRDGRWSKRIDFYRPDRDVRAAPPTSLELFSFEQAPLADLTLDVSIRSAQPFVVENNLVDGELECDLHLGGTGRAPDLVGSMFVGSTTVRLPASSLESQGGTIRFDLDDPLVPRLDVRFTTRTRGYDVQLWLKGTSLEPEVELSSSPPLSHEDLLLLVLTGKLPTSPWGQDSSQGAVENVAFFIGKDMLQGWFDSDSEGESWFDRIDWRTGVDVSQTGAKTTEFSFRLKGPQSGPGRTVLLRAEQDIYDHTNFGLRIVLRED